MSGSSGSAVEKERRDDPGRPGPAQAAARPRARTKKKNVGRLDWSTWPTYAAATTGLRNHWYPVTWAKEITKPTSVTLLGEKIALGRDGDRIWALADRCPHRGVPLSFGSVEFPGTISCAYHGWTFDTRDGLLCAAITDGPASPIVGKVSVQSYPVEQRHGLVWIYIGDTDEEDGAVVPPLDDRPPRASCSRGGPRWSDASRRAAAATGGTPPRTASTKGMRSTSTATRCGRSSASSRSGTRRR